MWDNKQTNGYSGKNCCHEVNTEDGESLSDIMVSSSNHIYYTTFETQYLNTSAYAWHLRSDMVL